VVGGDKASIVDAVGRERQVYKGCNHWEFANRLMMSVGLGKATPLKELTSPILILLEMYITYAFRASNE